jgi:hypothetical protein
MKEFWVTGCLTLEGVRFRIVAKDEAEARQKAAAGKWDDYERGTGESADWDINPDAVEGG